MRAPVDGDRRLRHMTSAGEKLPTHEELWEELRRQRVELDERTHEQQADSKGKDQ